MKIAGLQPSFVEITPPIAKPPMAAAVAPAVSMELARRSFALGTISGTTVQRAETYRMFIM